MYDHALDVKTSSPHGALHPFPAALSVAVQGKGTKAKKTRKQKRLLKNGGCCVRVGGLLAGYLCLSFFCWVFAPYFFYLFLSFFLLFFFFFFAPPPPPPPPIFSRFLIFTRPVAQLRQADSCGERPTGGTCLKDDFG